MNNIVDLACQVEGADSICYRIKGNLDSIKSIVPNFLYQELMIRISLEWIRKYECLIRVHSKKMLF